LNYWWVNQNQTYAQEVRGGYLWSPKANSNGARNRFYDNMLDVRPGDVVLSFCDTLIRAIGVATSLAESAPKPASFGTTGAYWNNEGWFVEVEFRELSAPIRPKDHMRLLEPTLPTRYSPLRATGDGNQGVYLAEIPLAMASNLLNIMGPEAAMVIDALEGFGKRHSEELAAEAELGRRTDIPHTEVVQLIKARRGQGLFKSRVELVELGCRVTGLRRPQHLVASHIKPWRSANDGEKLDGYNGLLLSPHVDHLFDRQFISFSDTGRILVSSKLTPEVLATWSIDPGRNVGAFAPEQCRYLEYHRETFYQQQER
jgi:putative restriction endonuclease